jgi:hypothetical protein
MGILAKIVIGALTLGAMGGVWAALSGYGAKPMRGASYYRPSVRSGSVGHSRGYYYGGKY